MTKTVTIAATRTNGDPYAHHDVIVTLVAGSAGGVVGSNVVVESSTVKLDADGEGSIVLETNEAITSPATSFYRFTVADSSPTITRSVRLTDDLPSTVSWTLADIQVGDPTIPQRDVSSDYVTIGGQSLTNYLATVGGGGGGVALGETSTTAYRGDRGKTAYDHTSLTNNPHSVTAAQVGAASNAAVPFKAQVGDWVSEPHDATFAATQTLNRLTYVPWLVPAGFAQTDGIAVEVTTVAISALCRLGIYLPHATTGRPGALVVDGGTVDFSSGGGAAGIRTLTITATNLTPGSLIYVAVVPQGATAAARHTSSGEVLRSYGYASSTVADVFRVNGASAYYEGSVTGALPANATPLIGNIVGQPVVALRRSA